MSIEVFEDTGAALDGGQVFETQDANSEQMVARRNEEVKQRGENKEDSPTRLARRAYYAAHLDFPAARQAQSLYEHVARKELSYKTAMYKKTQINVDQPQNDEAYIRALGLNGRNDPRHIRWMR